MLKIQNRRYIGNKYKLLNFINDVLSQNNVEFSNVCDMFAGTGSVSAFFLNNKKHVIVNDNLYSNFVFYNAWLSGNSYSKTRINEHINKINNLSIPIFNNYFSDTFSGTYFSYKNAKIIGSIRQYIEELYIDKKIKSQEYFILLSSLLYEVDKIANTVGHFEAFLGKEPNEKKIVLKNLNICKYKYKPQIFKSDANKLIRKIECDLLYLDPPYNARQYINFYHLLENLAEWKKPKVFGKTLKMERDEKKSLYSTSKAKKNLLDLVSNAKVKYILLSYNNTYSAKSGASINKITEHEIENILNNKGQLKKYTLNYKHFNSGKTNLPNHQEMLFLCSVKN